MSAHKLRRERKRLLLTIEIVKKGKTGIVIASENFIIIAAY